MSPPLPKIYPSPKSIRIQPGRVETPGPTETVRGRHRPGGYALHITAAKTILSSSDESGRQAGLATLAQLAQQAREEGIPELEIEDYPDLSVRGFVLDISRGKVPNRRTLEELVMLLWKLKYNQLQLYLEHAFAYRDHKVVWQGAGPLTADDFHWLDDLCHHHGIELVPNQNSFGHMGNWLRHEAYQYLAECPGGFDHPLLGHRPSGTVLRPGPESAHFIDGLLRELLPCFRSQQVNIGCDETWELGQGASRKAVEKGGKHRVFLDHLNSLVDVVRSHGKQPQFWADIFLKDKESPVPRIPDVLPIVWGYEPGHPFRTDLERLTEAGYPFLVATGTSCWNSLGGRWPTARTNILEASHACREFNGQGLLLTSWGDNGHAYPFAVMLPPIIFQAALAWNEACPDPDFLNGLDLVFGKSGRPIALGLLELGGIDRDAGAALPNMSGIFMRAMEIGLKGVQNPFIASTRQLAAASDCLVRARTQFMLADSLTNDSFHQESCLAADITEQALWLSSRGCASKPGGDLWQRFSSNWRFRAKSPVPECVQSGLFRRKLG